LKFETDPLLRIVAPIDASDFQHRVSCPGHFIVSISYIFPFSIATEQKIDENFRFVILNTAFPCFLSAKDSVIVVINVKNVEKLV